MMDDSLKGALGVRTADGSIVQLLDFQSRAGKRALFTTIADGQRLAVFEFYFRGAGDSGWAYLDSLSLPNIPAARAGEPDLELEAKLDSQGDLRLKLRDPATGRPMAFQLEARRLHSLLRQRSSDPRRPSATSSGQTPVVKRKRILLIGLAVCVVLAAGGLLYEFTLHADQRQSAALAEQTTPASPRADSQVLGPETAPDTATSVKDVKNEPPSVPLTPPSGQGSPVAASAPRSVPQTSEPGQGSPAAKSAPSKAPPASAGEAEYRIVWGDTLWRITQRYYGEWALYQELAKSNALKDPDFIVAGRSLVLPSALGERKRKEGGE